jgi:hypothetical protein
VKGNDNRSSSNSTSYQGSTSSSCSNLLIDKLYDQISSTSTSYQGSTSSSCSNLLIHTLYNRSSSTSTSYQGSTSSSCSNLLIDKLYDKGYRKIVLGRGEAPLNFRVGLLFCAQVSLGFVHSHLY